MKLLNTLSRCMFPVLCCSVLLIFGYCIWTFALRPTIYVDAMGVEIKTRPKCPHCGVEMWQFTPDGPPTCAFSECPNRRRINSPP